MVKNAPVANDEIMLAWETIDTGPGFDRDEEAVMFKPFSQVDGSLTRKHGGSGLGLVISRQLAELHGGRLTCTSTKGVGSTFVFTAQFKISPEEQEKLKVTQIPSESPQRERTSLSLASADGPEVGLTVTSGGLALVAASDVPMMQNANTDGRRSPTQATQIKLQPSNEISISSDVHLSPSSISSAVSTPLSYEILIISHTAFSRVAINHHVRVTVPRNIPSNIVTSDHYNAALDVLQRKLAPIFTHIVINLEVVPEILELASTVLNAPEYAQSALLIITTPLHRSTILDAAIKRNINLKKSRVHFIFKVLKPAKFSAIFDPSSLRNESTDMKRQSAQQVVSNQKAVFHKTEQDVGGRGYKVLLVEDNPVNQKVMTRFLLKVGLAVEKADDGVECLREFLARPDYFSLILMDLHMPNLDGYQACKEIRRWERQSCPQRTPIPIIALSANVMSDVAEKCAATGFTSYLSKPVAFSSLSSKIAELIGNPTLVKTRN